MLKSFIGKFGRNAREEFARKIHRARLSGDLKITPKMENQIDERFTKVFTKKGKVPVSVKERDIEKEVLNPLRLGRNDYFSPKNVDAVDKEFGFTDHTKQIGGKYNFILQQERKAAFQKCFKEPKIDKKTIEIKKTFEEPSRYEFIREKITLEAKAKEKKRKDANKSKYAENSNKASNGSSRDGYFKKDQGFGGLSNDKNISNNRFGGVSNDRYAKNDNMLGGIKSNGRDISETATGHGVPQATKRGFSSKPPIVHIEAFKPPVD